MKNQHECPATMIPGLNVTGMDWLATRPPEIQALIREFPPGMRIQWADGSLAGFVCSYGEGPDGLLISLSPVSLHDDYDAAMAQRDWVHVHCLRDGQPGEVGKPFDLHQQRADREGITRNEAKRRTTSEGMVGTAITTRTPQSGGGTKPERSEMPTNTDSRP